MEWEALGDPTAASIMTRGLDLRFHTPPPLSYHPPPCAMSSPAQLPDLRTFIPGLLSRRIIRELRTPLRHPVFFSRLFLVSKKEGTLRPVLDLSRLNDCLVVPHFKMESIQSIAMSIVEPMWGCTLDLEDAFFHVPISWLFHCYLAFVLDNRVFVFQYLPFGLALAPWAFNRVTNPIKSHLHLRSIRAHSYLDDFFFLQSSPEGLRAVLDYVLDLFLRLGISVNFGKSNLTPSQDVQYLGAVFHLSTLTLSLPLSKVGLISSLARGAMSLQQCSRRHLESLMGVLNWASNFVPLGRLHLRPLIKWMNSNTSPSTRDLPVPLDNAFRSSLQVWSDRSFLELSVPMSLPLPSLQLMTDASQTGWCGILLPHQVEGTWPPEYADHSSNSLELRAILLSLRHFTPILQGKAVMAMTDNTTAVACLHLQGSYQSDLLMGLSHAILTHCHLHSITLIPKHISGELNVLADQGSRASPIPTEWSLDRRTFKWLLRLASRHGLPRPQVDLFATRHNAQLSDFVSPVPDDWAVEVNALSLDWDVWTSVYLFPPVNLLNRLLPHLWRYKGRGILVAPFHAKAAWFPTLVARCPVRFPLPTSHSLSQVTSRGKEFHRYPQALQLHAWIL